MDDELREHIEMYTKDLVARGLAPAEAARRARAEFGGIAAVKEQCRQARGLAWIDGLSGDARHAVRRFARSPGFVVVAVLSLGLGIGGNAAVFSVVDRLFLTPLPVPEPEQLVAAYWTAEELPSIARRASEGYTDPRSGRTLNSSFPTFLYEAFRSETAELADLFAFTFFSDAHVLAGDQPFLADGLMVSGNFFTASGLGMALGRPFSEADDAAGALPTVVLTHGFWTRAYGRDPGVVGRDLRINGTLFRVIGVAEREFVGMSLGGFFPPADLLVPLVSQPVILPPRSPADGTFADSANAWWLRVMARLKAGVPEDRLEAALTLVFSQEVQRRIGDTGTGEPPRITMVPGGRGGSESLQRQAQSPLRILWGLAGLVFLLAAVNVANLVLARQVGRQKETEVRLVLGSGAGRLIRQMFVESLLLGLAGGGLALLFATWGGPLVASTFGGVDLTLGISPWLLGFVVIVSVLAAAVCTLIPAFRIARLRPSPVSEGSRSTARSRVDRVFVVSQMTMTIVILASAGMLIQSLWNLHRVETGFDTENLLLLEINPGLQEAAAADPLYARVRTRVESVPGVRRASFVGTPLLTGAPSNTTVSAEGAESQNVHFNWVGADFFKTLGIAVLSGRDIEESDYQESRNVVVINESAARLLLPGQAALGRVLSSGFMGELEIVGIVRDSRYEDLRGEMPPTIFVPYTQFPRRGLMTLVVRTVGDPLGVVPAIQTAVREVAPEIPVTEVSTQTSEIEVLLAQELLLGRFLGVFGGMALLLAAIGIYGVTSNTVGRRVREIGVRIAVGARSGDIFRMVLGNVGRLALVGLMLGLPAAVVASRLVRAQLFGLEPGDPWSLGAAAGLMLLVALGAGFTPARRAARIAPLEAIRHE